MAYYTQDDVLNMIKNSQFDVEIKKKKKPKRDDDDDDY